MLTNFYPKLRSASSVQLLRIVPVVAPPVVKEEIKVVEVDTVKRTPQKPVVQEPKPCRCDPPLMAIKTNLASWATLITPNIAIGSLSGQPILHRCGRSLSLAERQQSQRQQLQRGLRVAGNTYVRA